MKSSRKPAVYINQTSLLVTQKKSNKYILSRNTPNFVITWYNIQNAEFYVHVIVCRSWHFILMNKYTVVCC